MANRRVALEGSGFRGRQLISLLAFVAASFGAAALGSAFTFSSVETWYRRLRKPRWTPPNQVFGPVWTVLYAQMAIAAWLVRRAGSRQPRQARQALGAWVVQLMLNTAWSAAFFGRRSPTEGLLVIVALWCAIAATAGLAARVSRLAAVLLLPYLGWTTFATALNASIWRMNRRSPDA
jgi:tryptophan-rich sensory protein